MPIELTLLGTVAYRGREVTAPRLRALLALLVGDLGRGAGVDSLVDGLWPDERPENPVKAVQILVARLRRQLGAEVVVTTATGYRVALGPGEVDTDAIRRAARRAAQALAGADYGEALAQAETGLGLWGGEGADGTDPVSLLRLGCRPARRALVRARAVALAKLGRHAEAHPSLERLVLAEPRDEELLAELLRTEAAVAGQAQALTRYERYRCELRDELGVDPGPALRAVHQWLLRGDAVRRNVVQEPNALLGRDEDIATVVELVRRARITSVLGPGGMGKTRLAHAVSRAVEYNVYFVPLAGLTAGADIENEVAAVLGDQRRNVLLVLDNCEHVIDEAAALARALVASNKDIRILTTSRAPLGLSAETVYQLDALPLATAVELFRQRAVAARPSVELRDDVVARLCGHLDGLPLAIELAAAKARVMSVPEIAARLDDRFTLLRGAGRDAPARHRTLHAVVGWSWNLLDEPARRAMRLLSVFPGGFTYAAAEHVGADGELENLVDQSLLKVSDGPGGARFHMLDTVREFTAAQGRDGGEVEAFLSWATEFGLEHHELLLGNDTAPTFRADAEQDNLIRALRYGIERRDGRTVAATAALLTGVWLLKSNYGRVFTHTDEIADVLLRYRPEPECVEAARMAVTMCVVTALLIQGPRATRSLVVLKRLPPAWPDTLPKAMSALLTTPDSPAPLVRAGVDFVASYVKESALDPYAALDAARRAQRLVADAVPWARLVAHARVGELCLKVGAVDEARRHYHAALGVFDVDVAQMWLSLVLCDLGAGRFGDAERWLESLPGNTVDGVGDHPGVDGSFVLAIRAETLLARAEVDAGLGVWRRALDMIDPRTGTEYRVASGFDPWLSQIQATVVVAHAWHGRVDQVADLARGLPERLVWLLRHPSPRPSPFLREYSVWGTLLLAVALPDVDRVPARAARMIALAERLWFLREFQPTMAPERVRAAAENADVVAYTEAVAEYATLGGDDLRVAALRLLDG